MELILIPAGTFDMGSDKGWSNAKPVQKVTLKKAFYIGKYEVTQEQWQAVMGTNPSRFHDPRKPVDSVVWTGWREFVAKLSEKTERKFALPSEAEWEYTCRAGSKTEFCYGDGEAGLGEFAWHMGNSWHMTHLVGQKKPNKFGVFDMHGNVWEWCEDLWHDSYEGAPTDGSAWVERGIQAHHVLRGGSWYYGHGCCRSAFRGPEAPANEEGGYGARVVLRDF